MEGRMLFLLNLLANPAAARNALARMFKRLFVGPKALLAPPRASAYLEPEGPVMGDATLLVRKIYDSIGPVSPWEGWTPDDHFGLEPDAAATTNMEHPPIDFLRPADQTALK